MAPFSLMTAGFSLLTKSFGVFSCTNTLTTRCSRVLPALRGLSTSQTGPPKRPLNGYMTYVQQQRPVLIRQHPEIRAIDIVSKIAQQWRIMSPEQKKPFMDASVHARERFAVENGQYLAQLSPVQAALMAEERRMKLAKRKAIRKKKELNSLGKPKRPRSAFNIYMAEHYDRAIGQGMLSKMKSLTEEWRNVVPYHKKAYMQLAEDDRVRYKSEMKSWEMHMVEIGREDLLRAETLSTRRKAAAKKAKPRGKAAKKKTAAGKSRKTGKTTTASKGTTTTASKGTTVTSRKKA